MINIYEILQKVGFDWQVALANLVNFLIILFILRHFAFKPIKRIIEERQKKISEGLENAQKAKTEIMMAEIKNDEIVNKANVEAQKIVNQAAKEGKEIIEKVRLKAREEAKNILLEAQKEKNKEMERLQKDFKVKSAEIVISSVQKIIKEELSEEKNKKYIKSVLNES